MNRNRSLLAVCFCAGLIGALFNSLLAWVAGRWGLPELLQIHLAPDLSLAWLYPRLIWGGLWGLFYALSVIHPRSRRHWVRKGLWVSLAPTLAQLLYFFPHSGAGYFGQSLGVLTPALIIFYNLFWGFFTGVFTRLLWGRG